MGGSSIPPNRIAQTCLAVRLHHIAVAARSPTLPVRSRRSCVSPTMLLLGLLLTLVLGRSVPGVQGVIIATAATTAAAGTRVRGRTAHSGLLGRAVFSLPHGGVVFPGPHLLLH